jgi:outer membrane immunogenic protein
VKKIVLAVSILVVSAVSASAADLAAHPYNKALTAPTPAYSWTGFYVGANVGGLWSNSDDVRLSSFTDTPGFGIPPIQAAGFAPTNVTLPRRSFIGGGQIGYNWQTSNFVFGLEADIDGLANQKSSFSVLNTPPPPAGPGIVFSPISTQVSKGSTYIGTVRGRAGMLLGPSFLAYVTGGLAYGDSRVNGTISNLAPALTSTATTSYSQTRTGWTVGGGAEWMFNSTWSFKTEFLYYDLGQVTTAPGILSPAALNTGFTLITRDSGIISRLGLNYHFSGPVVARY